MVTPNGDGRVHYDPYSPCNDGVGRWIVVEMGNLAYANGGTAAAVLVGISTGEDPNPADSPVAWTFFAIASMAPANAPNVEGAVDFPQVGFNTNWIDIVVNNFFLDTVSNTYAEPLVFVFQRQPSECQAAVSASPKVLPGGTCTGTSGTGTSAWYCNDTAFEGACPVINYHATTDDFDGSNLYLIRSVAGASGTLIAYEISGAVGSPSYSSHTSVSTAGKTGPGGGWTWSSRLPATLPQSGNGFPIATGPSDDRIVSCVNRNRTIYAAHTIGLPTTNADSTALQW
jgi:hypothetical protein